MTLHNAAALAALLMALAAAQGRGHEIPVGTGQGAQGATGVIAQQDGGASNPDAAMAMERNGDAASHGGAADAAMSSEHMAGDPAMSAHMAWSDTRPETAADRERAVQIVQTLRAALAKYKDYHVAEADGFKPFHPEVPQRMYHFTKWSNGLKAAFTFDPSKPTSLLYTKRPDGGYELIGAMYTAPRRTTQARLDQRVPLSVARWHRHVNLCFPPKGQGRAADWTKFGFRGSISTKAACAAAGGRFYPQVFGWMVHVYPWAGTQQAAWAH